MRDLSSIIFSPLYNKVYASGVITWERGHKASINDMRRVNGGNHHPYHTDDNDLNYGKVGIVDGKTYLLIPTYLFKKPRRKVKNSVRCKHRTTSHNRCKNRTKDTSSLCGTHKKIAFKQ